MLQLVCMELGLQFVMGHAIRLVYSSATSFYFAYICRKLGLACRGAIASGAHADKLQDHLTYWETKALMCDAGARRIHFPNKKTNDAVQT